MKKKKKMAGFTLIELLVVCAVIAILAGVIIVSMSNAKEKSRDSRRLSDTALIAKAYQLYYEKNNTYIVSGATVSQGWFNSDYGQSGKSLAQILVNGGYVSNIVSDPSGDVPQTGNYAYMIYLTDGVKLSAYAKLENPTTLQTGTLANSAIPGGPSYCGSSGTATCGMNYAATIIP